MALPKQLREQVKNSKELEQAIRDSQRTPESSPSPQDEIDSLLAEVQAPDEPPKPNGNVTELHPQEPAEPQAPAEPKPERNDWKQKYTVLRGKYDAEVPRLTRELERSNERLGKLEELLAKREAEEPPKPAAPAATFTQEEIDEYGADLLDVIGRKAREIVAGEYLPQINSLKQEIKTLEQQLGTTSQRVRKQEQNEVFAVLDREVKDWRTINVDPAFKDWLGQTDRYTGRSREKLMLEAFNANDAHRVKNFFVDYVREHAAVTPEPTDPPAAPAAPAGATLDLGAYVAPGTPKGGGQSGAPREKRNWSRAEIRRFYSDVQKGHYRDRPDDKARIEADIVDATNTGRVTA